MTYLTTSAISIAVTGAALLLAVALVQVPKSKPGWLPQTPAWNGMVSAGGATER